MGLNKYTAKQFGNPTGLGGRLMSRIMNSQNHGLYDETSIAFHAWVNVVLSVFSVTSLFDGSDSPVMFAACLLGFTAAATVAVYIFEGIRGNN